MKITDTLKRRVTLLLTAPGTELGRWARLARFQIQLWRFCFRRLRENNAMAMSSALSFRTIFALVPTLILAILVLKSFGAVGGGQEVLQTFFRYSGLSQIVYVRDERLPEAPTTQPTTDRAAETAGDGEDGWPKEIVLSRRIEQLVQRVESRMTLGKIGPVGIAVLIWAALTLMTTLERSLNRIFGAPRSRSIGRRVLLYWSVLTLGPLVLVGAAYGANQATSAVPGLDWVLRSTAWLGQLLLGILLLAALYVLMPNTRVLYRVALRGAVLAVPLWAFAKWGFALYVDEVGRRSLYGAMGLIPLFLLWLNLSWWFFLFGAEVAHTSANLAQIESAAEAERTLITPWHLLAMVLTVARDQDAGDAPAEVHRLARAVNVPDESVERMVQRLQREGIFVRVAGGEPAPCVMGKSADRVRVADVLAVGSPCDGRAAGISDRQIADAVAEAQSRSGEALGELTVAELVRRHGKA